MTPDPVRDPRDEPAALRAAPSSRNSNSNTNTDRERGDLPGDVLCPTCRTFETDDFTELAAHLFYEHSLTNAEADTVAWSTCRETFGAGWWG